MSELGLTYSKSCSVYIVYHTHVLNSFSYDDFCFSNRKLKLRQLLNHTMSLRMMLYTHNCLNIRYVAVVVNGYVSFMLAIAENIM